MKELLEQLLNNVHDIKENIGRIDASVRNLEVRLDRLEKMDSIEHRVAVNQIDLSDIKEIVEKMETFQREEILEVSTYLKNLKNIQLDEELNRIHKRLDAQLTKIAKNEEAILMIRQH